MTQRLPSLTPPGKAGSLAVAGLSLFCLVYLFVANPAWAQADARATIDTVERGFGYTIGDLVRRQITVRGKATGFSRELLPEPGAINAWLTLHSTEIHQKGGDVVLTLTYQITGANAEVSLLELPVIELRTTDQTLARIDARPISISPIIGPKPFVLVGLGDLQPDQQPATPDFTALRQRFTVFGITTAGLLALLGWRRWRRNQDHRVTPFAQARRALRNQKNPVDGCRLLHRAFDQTAGRSLFLEDLTQFFVEHPQFQPAADSIEHFFDQSRAVFFSAASGPGNPDLLRLTQALTKRLAKLEARAR